MESRERVLSDELFTRFCDHDAQWGPLLFLRPAREERLGAWRSLWLAALPGVPLGLLGSILLALIARSLDKASMPVYAFPLTLTAIYFATCQLTIAPAWNRRAARLARLARFRG